MHQRLSVLRHIGLDIEQAGKLPYRQFLVLEEQANYEARVAELRSDIQRYESGMMSSMGGGKEIQKIIDKKAKQIQREEALFYMRIPAEA